MVLNIGKKNKEVGQMKSVSKLRKFKKVDGKVNLQKDNRDLKR